MRHSISLRRDGPLGSLTRYTITAGPAAGATFTVAPGEWVQVKARECQARFEAETWDGTMPSWWDEMIRADNAQRAREYREEVGR